LDFETFAQANTHNCRAVLHLFNLIATRVDKTPNFNIFIGAGASASSGIRTAFSMIEEWRHNLFATTEAKDEYHSWLEKQDWYKSDEEYSRLFELVYDQPPQRRAYIENLVKEGKPKWGYAYLVSLIEADIFNVIFTTNFDDLIN
jgi:NAD-dependent SIR2 family protein deacetylase